LIKAVRGEGYKFTTPVVIDWPILGPVYKKLHSPNSGVTNPA